MAWRIPILLLAAALAGPAAAQTLPSLGPLRLGMGLDEVRAATPGTTWRPEAISRFTGRVFRLRSEPPLTLFGLEVELELHARYHEQSIRASAVHRRGSAEACERSALAWLMAAEPGLGPFAGGPPVTTPGQGGGIQWNTQRTPGGGLTVVPSARPGVPGRTDGETLAVGPRSSVLAEAFDDEERPRPRRTLFGGDPARLKLSATGRGPGYELEIRVDYQAAQQGDDCSIALHLYRLLAPALPQAFDAAAHPLREQASIAARHLAYGDTPAPPEPVEVTLRCDIDRVTGWARRCQPIGPRVPPGLEVVAMRRAAMLGFDMAAVDRDDPVPMRGTVRVRLAPEDRRPLDFAQAPRTPWEALVLQAGPDPGDFLRFYPEAALDGGAAADVALACRVEADGSLLCLADGGEAEPRFVQAALRLAAATYRAAPTLRDGSPSAGRVVTLSLPFRPPEGAASTIAPLPPPPPR